MGIETGLHLEYLPLAECDPARWSDVLGAAAFNCSPGHLPSLPIAEVRLPVLDDRTEVCEVWRTGQAQAIRCGAQGQVRYTQAENVLFGCVTVPESALQDGLPDGTGAPDSAVADADGLTRPEGSHRTALHKATELAYREICSTLDTLGFRHLLRVWNYLSDINRETHGTERYRQFNRARQDALLSSGRAVAGTVPAASALGAGSGNPLVIYFLAGRDEPAFIENPRQVSAYDYPPQYGERTPTFSRATVFGETTGLTLFVSGTASIVGHRTVHVGDAAAQTRETLTNIDALLGEANRVTRGARFTLDRLAYKVYVRDPADLPQIQAQLRAAAGAQARAVYLKADICRQDLLVEIEATGRHWF